MTVARTASRRGYTMIEVMMALSLLGIGAMGVIAMQKTTLLSNTNARNLGTATAIATTWAERLRADGMTWTNADSPTLPSTRWLKAVGGTVFDEPETIADLGSSASDVVGADLYGNAGEPAQAYCTQIRLTQMYPTLIRAEIRVFWDRRGNPVTCDDDAEANYGRYGFVYLTTGIHQTIF